MARYADRDEETFSFYFKVAFWLVVLFLVISFVLWLLLPVEHRSLPVLERT